MVDNSHILQHMMAVSRLKCLESILAARGELDRFAFEHIKAIVDILSRPSDRYDEMPDPNPSNSTGLENGSLPELEK